MLISSKVCVISAKIYRNFDQISNNYTNFITFMYTPNEINVKSEHSFQYIFKPLRRFLRFSLGEMNHTKRY